MKGKGKGISDQDCPLLFPDLEPVDHETKCPKYTAILARPEEEGIVVEELDQIQIDVETLLAAVGLRLKQLEEEKSTLNNWQDKKDGKLVKNQQPETPPPSLKRGKTADEKPSKKFKSQGSDVSGKGSHATPPGKPKGKIAQVRSELEFAADSPEILPRLHKNDVVNKFWQSVEPYCSDITNEDIKVLEDLLRSHDNDDDYFRIPPLGKHYTEKWAEEDILEEQRDGAKMNSKTRNTNNNHYNNTEDSTTLLKKAEQNNIDESPFGPLTQRLVSALIEENIMTSIDDVMTDVNGGSEAPAISPKALAKQLNIGNPSHLEKRIKRELEEQGLLDSEDKVDDDPDDEILMELKQKQQELKTLCQHNISMTKNMLDKAREEMKKQDMKKKLAAADSEILEAYRKVQLAKQKKKTPTKKERDSVWKALKDRENMVKMIEGSEK
ncbi:transcriptional adapter 3-B-like [Mytilus californianus]|uniref:transcriptional adapter 3-B-like n=1 Tax=Mytilus californianus TaxID=6549 RepID=UPI0022452916|nr:transcriptional adapter 3-B-like [Mytilus californianus]